MKILGIDTSSTICSVAILEDKKILKCIEIDDKKSHSENLMPMIDKVLSTCNLTLKDIDLICCNKGPGSFTGIRIGIATLKAFNDSLDIPSIGVSSLKSLAYSIKENGLICTLIDARNDNVYFGMFSKYNDTYEVLKKYDALHIAEVIEILKKYEGQITYIGDGAIFHSKLLKDSFGKNANFLAKDKNKASSINICIAGLDKYNNGKYSPTSILPLYLRPSQAERLFKKD